MPPEPRFGIVWQAEQMCHSTPTDSFIVHPTCRRGDARQGGGRRASSVYKLQETKPCSIQEGGVPPSMLGAFAEKTHGESQLTDLTEVVHSDENPLSPMYCGFGRPPVNGHCEWPDDRGRLMMKSIPAQEDMKCGNGFPGEPPGAAGARRQSCRLRTGGQFTPSLQRCRSRLLNEPWDCGRSVVVATLPTDSARMPLCQSALWRNLIGQAVREGERNQAWMAERKAAGRSPEGPRRAVSDRSGRNSPFRRESLRSIPACLEWPVLAY